MTETVPPCTPVKGVSIDPCEPDLSIDSGGGYYPIYPPGIAPESLSQFLEGSSVGRVPHIVLRGTFLPNTVRCDTGYIVNYPSYLGRNSGTGGSGWTLEASPILYCFADVRVGEYYIGSGPPTLTLVVVNDIFIPYGGDPASLAAFENLWDRLLIEGGDAIPGQVIDNALAPGTSANILDTESIVGVERILFLSPLLTLNVEAWRSVGRWRIERKENGTLVAVHPERNYRDAESRELYGPQLEMTLPDFKQAVAAADTARIAANGGRIRAEPGFPMLVSVANALRTYYVEIGAYDDPGNPPEQPPPSYQCDDSTTVTNPGANRGMVRDCENLLLSKDSLRGSASLNWSANTAFTGWEGVTVMNNRVTKVELPGESLSGIIPATLGDLLALTHLDLSNNSLTGSIPRELTQLDDLQVLRLSGNTLSGCIPQGLKDIPTNDLSSLNLLDCPPAPSNPSLGTLGEATVPLTWSAVANAVKYRVEYRKGADFEGALHLLGDWTIAAEVPTGTSHTVTGLVCRTEYRVRVRAYGNGSNISAEWGSPSESVSGRTAACVTPVFAEKSYSFMVAENSATGTAVGTVSATDPNGDTISYSITAGNPGNAFAIGPSTGAITVAAGLDFETTPSYELTVEATDGTNAASATVVVSVTDVNESPAFEQDSYSFSPAEDASVGAAVGTVTATDPDEGDTVTYSITAGNSGSVFAIGDETGEITVAGDLSGQAGTTVTLTVEATDGTTTTTVAVEITIAG